MIFSRIVGTVSRCARSRLQSNLYSGFRHGRILSVTESCLEAKPCVYGGLGFAKAYLPSNGGIGAGNQIVSRNLLPDNHSVLASPTIRRLFSTELPEKRNYDIKKEIPQALQEQKSESSDGSWPKPFSDDKYFNYSDYIHLFTFFYVVSALRCYHREHDRNELEYALDGAMIRAIPFVFILSFITPQIHICVALTYLVLVWGLS